MTKRRILITALSFFIVFLALAITFLFTDLQISIALASNNVKNPNFFLKLCAALGEFPIYIGPIMFGLIYGLTNRTRLWQLIAHFVGFVVTYVASIRLVGGVFEEFLSSELGIFHYSLLAVSSLLLYTLFYLIFTHFNEENLLRIKDVATIMTIVSAASFVIITGTKYVVGRVRFRALDESYSEFTNFITIKNFLGGTNGDDFRSFPSGHTGSATCIIMLTMIPMRLSNKKWMGYTVFALSLAYALTIALSRVFIGAHYASDVLFGFTITIVCFLITYFVFKKKGWLNARGN